jgi:hypothetical protein
VSGQLREQIGIIGKTFNLESRSIDVDSQKLGTVGGKGDLFNLVGIDQFQKIRVPDIRGLAVGILSNDGKIIIL